MAQFCVISDLECFLQIDIPAERHDAAIRAIEEASAAIQNYCHQQLSYVADDEITLDCAGGNRLFLPELPVISVKKVIEDGKELTATVDYKLGRFGILYRVGRDWADGVQVISVTYTHGYTALPDDIVSICVRAAARAYQAGLRADEMDGVPGVSSKSLGDFSVAYGSEQSVGAGEAVLGASAAPILLRSEKETLNRYRI